MNSLLNIFLSEADDDKLFAEVDNTGENKTSNNKKTNKKDDTEDSSEDTDTGDDETNDLADTDISDDDTDTSDSLDDTGADTTDDNADDLGGSSDLDDTNSSEDSENVTDDSTDDIDTKLKSKILLKSFVNLYNDINEIIDRIDSADKCDNKVESITLNRTSSNLKSIKEILFDYIKSIYTTKPYDENLYYYHYILNSTKMTKKIFDKIIEIRGKA